MRTDTDSPFLYWTCSFFCALVSVFCNSFCHYGTFFLLFAIMWCKCGVCGQHSIYRSITSHTACCMILEIVFPETCRAASCDPVVFCSLDLSIVIHIWHYWPSKPRQSNKASKWTAGKHKQKRKWTATEGKVFWKWTHHKIHINPWRKASIHPTNLQG